MTWVAVAVGGSAAIGAGASYLGSQSQNNAAKNRTRSQRAADEEARNRLGLLQFGPSDYADFQLASGPRFRTESAGRSSGFNPLDPTGISPLNKAIGGFLGFGGKKRTRRIDQGAEVDAAKARFFGKYKSLDQTLTDANARYIGDLEGNQAGEERATRSLDALAAGNENAGQDVLAGEIARVKRDSARRLDGLNQRTTAQLGLLGPTSLVSNQTAANTRLSGEGEDNSILAAKESALARFQAARGARIALRSGRQGIEGELGRNLAAARRGSTIEPAESRMGLFGGSQFASRSLPGGAGQSALGSALGSAAQGLGQYGGFLAGQQARQPVTPASPQPIDPRMTLGGSGGLRPPGYFP